MSRYNVPKPLVERVRMWLRDYPEVNELMEDRFENTDIQIAIAIVEGLMDYNMSNPPLDPITLDRADDYQKTLMCKYAIINLLKSVSLLMQRNELQYSDGNVQVGLKTQWRGYAATIQNLEQEYISLRTQYKRALNIKQGFGYTASEWALISNGINNEDNFISLDI